MKTEHVSLGRPYLCARDARTVAPGLLLSRRLHPPITAVEIEGRGARGEAETDYRGTGGVPLYTPVFPLFFC